MMKMVVIVMKSLKLHVVMDHVTIMQVKLQTTVHQTVLHLMPVVIVNLILPIMDLSVVIQLGMTLP